MNTLYATVGKAPPRAATRQARSLPKLSFVLRRFLPAGLLLAASLLSFGGEPVSSESNDARSKPADLTFSNFFSTGWNEPWARRPRGDGTPDMSLLRVQTNFLVQLLRMDYFHQENFHDSPTHSGDSLTETVEYAFNRRFLLAVVGNYRWIDSRVGENLDGAAGAAFARFQWVDTATSSLATTLRAGLPNHDLGEKDFTLSLAVAGWRDLAPLGLKRVGLYYHVQEETLVGPYKSGSLRNDLTYAVSLAKTWTSPDSYLGNASTFIEAYGKTNLDGDLRGDTIITLTPGVRATIDHRHIFMAGVEFPLSHPKPFECIARFTYIFNF